MNYKRIPGTCIKVSELSIGSMLFGGKTPEDEALKILDCAYDNGINLWDTADQYVQGESEKVFAKALKGRRDDIVLVTKGFNYIGGNMNERGLSRKHLIAAVENSLKRLETDYIDIYYLHAPDYETSLEETMQTMDTLVRDGKIRYVGLSNFASWHCADVLAVCDKRNWVAPVITQNVYNLLTRGIEAELVPFSKKHDLGLAVYNPLAGGLLTGKHKNGKPAEGSRYNDNKMYIDRYWSDKNLNAVAQLDAIAEGSGMTLLEMSLRWCVQKPYVTSLVIGASRAEQLQQNVDLIDGAPLSEDVLKACDEVWKDLTGDRFSYIR